MGWLELLCVHACTKPVTPISLIDRTSAEIEVAQGAILGDLLAVGSEVCALCMVGGGNVHDRDEESESRNRDYECDH